VALEPVCALLRELLQFGLDLVEPRGIELDALGLLLDFAFFGELYLEEDKLLLFADLLDRGELHQEGFDWLADLEQDFVELPGCALWLVEFKQEERAAHV